MSAWSLLPLEKRRGGRDISSLYRYECDTTVTHSSWQDISTWLLLAISYDLKPGSNMPGYVFFAVCARREHTVCLRLLVLGSLDGSFASCSSVGAAGGPGPFPSVPSCSPLGRGAPHGVTLSPWGHSDVSESMLSLHAPPDCGPHAHLATSLIPSENQKSMCPQPNS